MRTLEDLKSAGEAPEFLTTEGFTTMCSGYLMANETPRKMYLRVSNAAASRLNRPDLAPKFFDLLWKNWLGLASPVASNMGGENLPISCFSSSVPDSTSDIFKHYHEIAMLSKYGGGTGSYWGHVRGRNVPISKGGFSAGLVPWLKCLESTVESVSQNGVRRGNVAAYLDMEHLDIEEFLDIRKNTGDISRKCLSTNFHHAVSIGDEFMKGVISGDKKCRKLFAHTLKNRVEFGEPYLMFRDTANRLAPQMYKDKGLKIETSNLCLSGDTLILTKEWGPTPIKDLVGKTATIFDGLNWIKNDRFSMTQENAEFYRIHLSDGSYVDATENHKWYAKPAHLRESEFKEYFPTQTKDLKEGMKLEYHSESIEGSIKAKGAYVKGFLLAEGTRAQVSSLKKEYKPLLYLYKTKTVCFERIKKSAEEIAPYSNLRSDAVKEISLTCETNERFSVSGIGCRRELLNWCTSYKSEFPEEIYLWDIESKCEFLAGLFDGDGTYMRSHGGYQIASVHRNFLSQIQILLKTIGIKSSLGLMRKGGLMNFNDGYGEYKTQDAYRLTVSSYWAYNMSEKISFSRLSKYHLKKPNRFCASFNEVVKIEKLQTSQPAFCTNVPSTSKFALANGLITGNCNEIYLHTDANHTFVCCLSSMNLARYDEWKDTDAVYLATYFLDGVMQEFIDKAKNIEGFEKAVRFAEKSRALGLGVIGWHTLLQIRNLPFDSFESMQLNAEVFRKIESESLRASRDMALEFGEPEWCKGYGLRNTHTTAVAPTTTNSILAGGVSQGIEPISANIFNQKTSKGVFIRKNPILEKLLQSHGQDNLETWNQINEDRGSVKNLTFLSPEEKEIFLTAREINQFAIVRQAAQRQKWISQGQSVNLLFSMPQDITDDVQTKKLAKYINEVHLEAWRLGLKGLYYLRTESVLKGESIFKESGDCKACEA